VFDAGLSSTRAMTLLDGSTSNAPVNTAIMIGLVTKLHNDCYENRQG